MRSSPMRPSCRRKRLDSPTRSDPQNTRRRCRCSPSQDAHEALGTLQALPFGQRATVQPGIDFNYHRQGHILGAAAVELRIKVSGGEHTTLYFSGDVGRYDVPILKAPEPYPGSTYLVVESTYGDSLHDPGDPRDQLAEVITEAVRSKGVILIPAFAIDRTQEVLFFLRELIEDGTIDPLPIFLDSPMAREATEAYRSCALEHDAEMRELVREGIEPLVPANLVTVGTVDESKRLNKLDRAGTDRLGFRHGHRGAHPAPPPSSPAGPEHDRRVCRLPGGRHAGTQDPRW